MISEDLKLRDLFSDEDRDEYREYTNDNYELVLEEDIGFTRYYIIAEPGMGNSVHKVYLGKDLIGIRSSMEEAKDLVNEDFWGRFLKCCTENG